MYKSTLDKILNVMSEIISSDEKNLDQLRINLQECIFDSEEIIGSESIDDILRDLAISIDYYQPNEKIRIDSKGTFGSEKLLELIKLSKLKIENELKKGR